MANKLFWGRFSRLSWQTVIFGRYVSQSGRDLHKKCAQIVSLASKPSLLPYVRRFSFNHVLSVPQEKLTDPLMYEKISDETLDELSEYLENSFQEIDTEELDTNLSSGVLTIHLGKTLGTYVINKQAPNRQIWLSSPISGPKRFDFVNGKWIYSHDGSNLHELLEKELSENLKYNFDLKSLDYYNLSDN